MSLKPAWDEFPRRVIYFPRCGYEGLKIIVHEIDVSISKTWRQRVTFNPT